MARTGAGSGLDPVGARVAAATQHDTLARVLRRHELGAHVRLGCGHGDVCEAEEHIELGEKRDAVLHHGRVGGRHLDHLLGDLRLRRLVLALHGHVLLGEA